MNVEVKWQRVGLMLDAIRARLNNLQPVWLKAQAVLSRTIAENFTMGGRPSWPARKEPAPHPLLVKTGKLRSRATSLQLMRTANGALFFANVGPVGVAHIHGVNKTFLRRGHPVRMRLPARDFMTATGTAVRQIADMIGRHVVGKSHG